MAKYIITETGHQVCFLSILNEQQKINYLTEYSPNRSPYSYSMMRLHTDTENNPNKVDMV